MGMEFDAGKLLAEVRAAREMLGARDSKMGQRLDDLEDSVNDLHRRLNRPGADGYGGSDRELERKQAVQMCEDRRSWSMQKSEGGRWLEYQPSGDEIEEAIGAQRAFKALLRNHGDFRRLDQLEQKSLSAFAFGNSGWMLPPEFSSRVLSCLTDPDDFLSLLSQETISGGSRTFPFDNSELEGVGFACETSCDGSIASIPPPGQIEIKPESLRCRICATQDILEDAAFSVELWLARKVERAFRQKLSAAFVNGTGMGMPQGILNRASGIPICDVNSRSAAGEWSWQDLISLRFQLDPQYAARATFLMNSTTLGLCMSMADGMGRPVWMERPSTDGRVGSAWMIAGCPVRVSDAMPDPTPGSTPVLVADLQALYQVISRRGLTFSTQPAGWCSVFLFSQRIGGAVICPNAGRLMRVQ